MDEIESDLARAGDALRDLAEGPGREAAQALEQAFGRAGRSIESALAGAARSGELNFQRMAESILRDLARVATEALIAGVTGGGGQTVNVNMNVAAGADASRAPSPARIASAVAGAAARGGRFL